MSAVFEAPKTDWSLTAEEGISTADLNRIEGNTEYIREQWNDYRVVISGNWNPAPVSNTPMQFIHIKVPVGYKLVLDRVNYYFASAGGVFSVKNTTGAFDLYFDSEVDNAGLDFGNVKLQKTIYTNETDEPVGLNIGVYNIANANRHAGWSIDFVKLPI